MYSNSGSFAELAYWSLNRQPILESVRLKSGRDERRHSRANRHAVRVSAADHRLWTGVRRGVCAKLARAKANASKRFNGCCMDSELLCGCQLGFLLRDPGARR